MMTRISIFLFLVCLAGCQQTPLNPGVPTSDSDLAQLKAALDSATTQTDMNLASYRISEFWGAKLASVEQRMSQHLDQEQRKAFSDSQAQWRDYRIKEVQFRSGFYEGGSVRPLIANVSYSEITEQRVAELESILSDELERK